MIFFPAIDLKDGVCVRLVKGDMSQSTVFNDSPADQARQFSKAGADSYAFEADSMSVINI